LWSTCKQGSEDNIIRGSGKLQIFQGSFLKQDDCADDLSAFPVPCVQQYLFLFQIIGVFFALMIFIFIVNILLGSHKSQPGNGHGDPKMNKVRYHVESYVDTNSTTPAGNHKMGGNKST